MIYDTASIALLFGDADVETQSIASLHLTKPAQNWF